VGSYVTGGGAGGANQNLNNAYELLGFNGTTGAGVGLTSGVVNTKGTGAAIGTTSSAWAGFWMVLGVGNTAGNRYMIDLSDDGGSTWAMVPNYFWWPATSGGPAMVWVPLAVAASTVIHARCQSNAASATTSVALIGAVDNAQSAPMYTTMTALNTDTATTLPSTDVPLNGAGYTTLVASTAAQYGAFHLVLSYNGTQPGTSQALLAYLASGAAFSEADFAYMPGHGLAANPQAHRNFTPMPFDVTVASGQRISAKIIANMTGTDNYRIGVYGFS